MSFSKPTLNIKTSAFLFCCLLISLLLADLKLQAQNGFKADDINGEWWTPDNDGRMIFFRSEGKYFGMVSWLKRANDPVDGKPRRDKLNPDPSLRDRPLLHLILFSDFTFDAAKGKYTGGSIYDAEDSGKKYSCWLKLVDRNVLEIHGYVGFSLIGKSVFFTRVQK
jgi:uncharacterized protein (DUF2147 family)